MITVRIVVTEQAGPRDAKKEWELTETSWYEIQSLAEMLDKTVETMKGMFGENPQH